MIELPILGSEASYVLSPQKIIAVGLNYREHIKESPSILAAEAKARAAGGAAAAASREAPPEPSVPAEPVLFAKTPNVLIGPGQAIPIPASFLARYAFPDPRTDYEAELAVIIGRRCKDASVEAALSFVFGYSCFNDVSQRDVQNGDRSGWFRGKSFDGFGPIGPAIAPAASIKDPQALTIRCRLNGRVVQESSTSRMIFGVAELVSFISHNFTLEPGDVIATGTPSGVGRLTAGDLVEVEIEGIGALRNPVVER
jgi:2-keto-4-pentenoate hydratase/2-oxohepta-3-ene-1,7-dioic acid hydratase in catechol pathway